MEAKIAKFHTSKTDDVHKKNGKPDDRHLVISGSGFGGMPGPSRANQRWNKIKSRFATYSFAFLPTRHDRIIRVVRYIANNTNNHCHGHSESVDHQEGTSGTGIHNKLTVLYALNPEQSRSL